MANESTVPGYPRAGNRTPSACAQREEHWRRVLARQEQSGLTRAAFCRREGIKDNALSWWAREMRLRGHAGRRATPRNTRRKGASRHSFVPVRVIEEAPVTASALEVVTRSGHIIRLHPGFDPATLRKVVAALEGQPC